MSFGFSIGDFLAAIELANKIRKDFVGAPSQFKDISNVLRSLSIVLNDAEVTVFEHELNPQEAADFRNVLDDCQRTLRKLEQTVDKYIVMDSQQTSISGKLKKAWKRLSMEPEDIRDLRSDVNINIDLLTALTGRLTRDNTFKLVRYQEDKERQAILDWLTPTDYAPQQNDFLKQWQAGSGKWLLDSAEFKSWLDTKKQKLFCPGIPGAGKTILTSILSSRFQDESNYGIAYIYCNFKRQDEQTLEDLLASQLAQARFSLPQTVRSLHDRYESMKARPSIDDIKMALHSFSRVFILVDALDECRVNDSCRAKLLSQLSELQTNCGANLFATSRFEGDTWLEIRASEQDIQRYIEAHIDELPHPDLQQEISSKIVKAVDGMDVASYPVLEDFTNCTRFLLAQLYLNSLKGKRSRTAIRDALKKLPTGTESYNCAYSDAMTRIERQLPDEAMLAKEALSWITCAKRPLTTTELQHALAVKDGQEELDEDNKSDIEDIVSVCAGLVTVDGESGIIRLVHYTTQEYFERTQKNWFPNAEFDITTIFFGSGPCDTDYEFEKRLQLNPLYEYAARYWGHHACQVRSSLPKVIEFFRHEINVEAAVQAMLVRKLFPSQNCYSKGFSRQMTGLHLCAYFGLVDVAATVIYFAGLNSRNDNGQTPLFLAARGGHEYTGKVEIDLKDNYDQTPLLVAAREGHEGVVKLLLDTGKVEVDSRDKCGKTPLFWTARNGHEDVVKLLLDTGKAEIDSRDKHGRTTLFWAARHRHEDTGKVEVDSRDKHGRTPLFWVARNGHEDTGKIEVDSRDEYGETPLFWAARNRHEDVVKLLQSADNNCCGILSPALLWTRYSDKTKTVISKHAALLSSPSLSSDAKDHSSKIS
ncbi:LOW QUALITY PROTEIN: hypothetical protein J3E72DRAFT_413051 [Bipolaris maydis]|nr:LOW QUALITY PROTEIN: hypothetical protein J3E72DRAFT_413051 [Bipolaris maydis]